MGNGRGRGRGGRGGFPRGNRGSYRGGGYQGGGFNEYSSMGNEYQGFASNSHYGYANQPSHIPAVVRDDGFFESGNNGFQSFRGSQGITILSQQLICQRSLHIFRCTIYTCR